jgi:hypothetical protein
MLAFALESMGDLEGERQVRSALARNSRGLPYPVRLRKSSGALGG